MIELIKGGLTLPIDSKGKSTDTAQYIKELPSGYAKSPYFWYDLSDQSLVFEAPVEGATTSGSHYCRSELGGSFAKWYLDKNHRLSATVKVLEVPKKTTGVEGKIVIGQIHGPNDELCRLYYEKGKIYYVDDKYGSKKAETKLELKNKAGQTTKIPLGDEFSYLIDIKNKVLTVSVVYNDEVYSSSQKIGSFWTKKYFYFKAGVYLGVGKPNSGAGTEGYGKGKVKFYYLKELHGT